ncbi:hypothetical protein RchiOBHm_Chr1g0349421 [Rosa chinensis]|uniref:Non-specific serine/threonine protein kinase n=1 Tax=Rosa chinensis TaxID=74649 RepID=A0A2P6SFU5_ROSCH|nr:hypothetical protein RchiOBHm_Chr1g0349421 [Rosa chinensis]
MYLDLYLRSFESVQLLTLLTVSTIVNATDSQYNCKCYWQSLTTQNIVIEGQYLLFS